MAKPKRAKRGSFGFNGRISIPGSSRKIRATAIHTRMSIIAQEGEARARRAFYPIVTTGSSFSMDIAFVSYKERASFYRWWMDYLDYLADGSGSGYATVQVPRRDFAVTCIPTGSITLGEGLTDVGYVVTLSFAGASNSLDLSLGNKAGYSTYRKPSAKGVFRRFHPAGIQLSGAESLDGTIFDERPSVPTFDDNSEDTSGPTFYPPNL